jgi:hypothetical protein
MSASRLSRQKYPLTLKEYAKQSGQNLNTLKSRAAKSPDAMKAEMLKFLGQVRREPCESTRVAGEIALPDGRGLRAAKQQIAAIDKVLPHVRGAGSGKLAVAVRTLNDRITELDRQLAGLAKSAERLSKIL